MADSRMTQVHKKIAELIGVNFAAGYSGADLTGRVVRGSVVQPPYTPFACTFFVEARESYGPTLGRFQGTARFDIYCYIGGTSEATRNDNALNLSSDIVEALTNNRQLGLASGVIDDILCSFTALDGDKFGLDQIGIGYVQAEIKFQTASGA